MFWGLLTHLLTSLKMQWMCLSLDSPIGGNPIVYNRVKDGWGNSFMVANRIVAFWLLLVAFLDDFGNRWSRQFDLTDSDLRRDLENSKVLGYCSPTLEIGWEIPKLGQGRSQKERMRDLEKKWGIMNGRKRHYLIHSHSIPSRLIKREKMVKREREGESEWRKESRLISISPRLITSPRLIGFSQEKMGERVDNRLWPNVWTRAHRVKMFKLLFFFYPLD
jgi:hypothetical protein